MGEGVSELNRYQQPEEFEFLRNRESGHSAEEYETGQHDPEAEDTQAPIPPHRHGARRGHLELGCGRGVGVSVHGEH